ncbi:MAG TPA: hypothetical protein VGU01_13490 [Sphingomicrobium sp.]|nr:hypothetical protein [Sphingomicrobium sp.]
MDAARQQLDDAFGDFAPDIANAGRTLLEHLGHRLPGATILVYDNYNALLIGFAANDHAGSAVLSIALYPRWINLFFMRGVELDDPHHLLKGEGVRVRHVPKVGPNCLDDERIESLICQAVAIAQPPIDRSAPGALIMKSVSATKRARRPL